MAVIFGTDVDFPPRLFQQGFGRFSLLKSLTGITISRRYAAGKCADAQGPLTADTGHADPF